MRRRTVSALLAGVVALWPPPAPGQSVRPLRNTGMLMGLAETDPEIARCAATFRQVLRHLAWIEGHAICIHYRSAIDVEQLRGPGNEIVVFQPHVIVAGSSILASPLLREARTIPIVLVTASDPIGDGFVAGLAQPNGNVTGFTDNLSPFCGKWLELLQELAPRAIHFIAVCNPDSAPAGGADFLPALPAAAASMSLGLDVALLRKASDIESVLAARNPGGGIVVLADQFTSAHQAGAIYRFRSDTDGLISYRIDVLDLCRRVPSCVHRILNGAGDLAVQSPARTEPVINRRVATMPGMIE